MPSEITTSFIILVVVVIGSVTALVKFLPSYIQRLLESKQAEQEEKLKAEKNEREARINELQTRVEESKSLVEQISRGNDVNERLINSIIDIAKEQSTNNRVVSANTTAITGNTEALGDLNKTVERVQSDIMAAKADIKELRDLVESRLPSRIDCIDLNDEWAKFEERLLSRLQQPTQAVSTHVVTVDVAPVENKAAA